VDRVHAIVQSLLTRQGAFHVKIHYSSNQLTCWFCDDAYRYRVYVSDGVLGGDFLEHFPSLSVAHLKPLLHAADVPMILKEFKILRLTYKIIYLRNASINLVDGMIGMTFSCDGAHYIDHKTFFERLETFATPPSEGTALPG